MMHYYGKIDFTDARFIRYKLDSVHVYDSNLTDVLFGDCKFSRERMSGAIYENVKVIRATFNNYDPNLDDLDQVKFGLKSRIFDWSKLRILSRIPIFSISCSTLLGSLAIMNMIGWGSSNRDKISSIVKPLSMPPTLIELFIAACFFGDRGNIICRLLPASHQGD